MLRKKKWESGLPMMVPPTQAPTSVPISSDVQRVSSYGLRTLHPDAGPASCVAFQLLLGQDKGGVAVLAGVRVVVEPGHEHNAVDDHLPFLPQHGLGLLPECTRRHMLSGFLSSDELLRLWEQATDETGCERESGGDPEDRLPGLRRTSDTKIGASREDETERVTLLQNSAHQTTGIDAENCVSIRTQKRLFDLGCESLRAVLKSHGDGISIYTTHKQAKKGTNSEKLLEGCAVDGGNLQKACHRLEYALLPHKDVEVLPRTIMLPTMGHFLPNLSPSRPKTAAPTDRKSRVNVMAVEMSVFVLWKCFASFVV